MVYVFLADGFEEIEAVTVIDILRRAGIKTQTVGISGSIIKGAHLINVNADIGIDKVCYEDIDAIVLPGGVPGINNLESCDKLLSIIEYSMKEKKIIAAICAAPSILGNIGILKDKCYTCYPGFEVKNENSKLVDNFICKDENIITAKGPGVSIEFALKLAESLTSKETALNIMEEMQCR